MYAVRQETSKTRNASGVSAPTGEIMKYALLGAAPTAGFFTALNLAVGHPIPAAIFAAVTILLTVALLLQCIYDFIDSVANDAICQILESMTDRPEEEVDK
jgi:putative flippase GtrA